jgi:transcriptional regulator with XRE-family HTH domain
MGDELSDRLAFNVRQLRQARGLSQQQVAKLAGMPRATWANLESGAANPTLTVLHSVALALEVPIEELIATPKAELRLYRKGALPSRARGKVVASSVLPEASPSTAVERLELLPGARLAGTLHPAGTREHVACESGEIEVSVADESVTLGPGDVLVFRGDQRHQYANPGTAPAVVYSVVLLRPTQ